MPEASDRDEKTILVLHNTAHYIALHYREFLATLLSRGFKVHVAAPQDPAFDVLRKMGIPCHAISMSRRGLNPFKEAGTIVYLWRVVSACKPDILFNYSIKPVIYGSLVGRLKGVDNIFSMVTGLGYVFNDAGLFQRYLKIVVLSMYRLVMNANTKVFFQNGSDRDTFIQHRLLSGDKGIVINGTGISLTDYVPGRERNDRAIFILIGRMLWEKGVAEYVEAARYLKKKHPQARFQLLGPVDDNPLAISRDQLRKWSAEGAVEYLGETADVRPYIDRATVFVLPSYYREGRPRATLEAMALAKPVITTDWPGCREPVEDGRNGILVPVRDSRKLGLAMEKFILEPQLAARMGAASRRIAERDYDVHKVNEMILSYFPITGGA